MSFEKVCPRCKASSSRNANLTLLVNICGHKLCETCIDVLFTRPTASCFECGIVLRRSEYRQNIYENALVEKEVDIRKKLNKIYNKMLEDFSNYENPQKEYDDYLEHVEDIIYNLVNGIDVEYTNKEINEFKKENEAIIKKNYSKLSAIDSQILKQINKDNDIQVKNVRDSQKELSDNLKKAKNDRKTLIDQLMVSSASASEIILAQQHKKIHQNNPEEIRQEVVDIEIPLYTYQPQNIHILGPSIPEVLDEFLIRTRLSELDSLEKAGGFDPCVYIKLMLHESHVDLFLNIV